MATRRGKTIITELKPKIISFASVVGKKEGQGPLAREFDEIYPDTTMGEDSWEKAEPSLVSSSPQRLPQCQQSPLFTHKVH